MPDTILPTSSAVLNTSRVPDLTGKRGLVVGIANASSIAYGCAKAYRAMGAELAVTYLNPKSERFVRPLAEELGAPIVMPCDVTAENELEAVYAEIERTWGKPGIDHFDDLMAKATERAPTHHLTTIDEVGAYSAFLATDAAKSVTGQLVYIDGGYN